MKLRRATLDDAERLWRWRNDPETRANSISTDPVPLESHIAWLKSSLRNPDRKLLVAELDGEPVGTVRIDNDRELSWTVAPEARGRGIGGAMVAAVVFPGAVARIKRENLASQKIA